MKVKKWLLNTKVIGKSCHSLNIIIYKFPLIISVRLWQQEVSDDKLKESTLIVTSIEDLIKPIEQYFQAGFTQIYVHSTSPNELEFVQKFCTKVLPYFKDSK